MSGLASFTERFALRRPRGATAVGRSENGEVVLAVSGVFPSWKAIEGVAAASRAARSATGLAPGRVRVARVGLPPSDAATAGRVAAVQAEGLLPEGVEGDTGAGAASAERQVWLSGVSRSSRRAVVGPVTDGALGLGFALASTLGLAGDAAGQARLDSGVLLAALANDQLALVRVDGSGPTEHVVVDLEFDAGDDPSEESRRQARALALSIGVERIVGVFAAIVGVGGLWEDPREPGQAPLAEWLSASQAFEPLRLAGLDLSQDDWLAAGAAAAAASESVALLGTDAAAAAAADGPGPPAAGWWAAAVAAVLAAAGTLAWADLAAVARLDAALEAQPEVDRGEQKLSSDLALYRWLEGGGATPLAVIDELTGLLGGVVPQSVQISGDGLELEGAVDDPAKIDRLVERLVSAETLTSVKLQRTQRVSDREHRYSIEATGLDRFYDAFVDAPVREKEPEDAGSPDGQDAEADVSEPGERS